MINIAQTSPAVWSPPASTATAPVAAVAAVRPPQESTRNSQSGTGREQDSPSARAERRADAREPAGAGRDAPADGARGTAGRASAGGEASDLQARREAEQNTKQLATEQAAEETRRVQRQELLTNVWKASAAVVDRALGRDDTSAVDAAAPTQESAGSEPTQEQLALPWPVMPQDADAAPSRADLGASEEVVAYDEHGNGSVAPLEAGLLISRHV